MKLKFFLPALLVGSTALAEAPVPPAVPRSWFQLAALGPKANFFHRDIPGQFQVCFASARPAARSYYLLYAAALDQLASEKASLLAAEPTLAAFVQREYAGISKGFVQYDTLFANEIPVVDARAEANALAAGVNSGTLRPVVEATRAELSRMASDPQIAKDRRRAPSTLRAKLLVLGLGRWKRGPSILPTPRSGALLPVPPAEAGSEISGPYTLPGQKEVLHWTSTTVPARPYWLLYAAALDQYATEKAVLLRKEPVLAGFLQQDFERALNAYNSFRTETRPPYNEREVLPLEKFLATGYRGKLRGEIEAYLAMFK